MKFLVFFVVIASAVFGFRELMTKRNRRHAVRSVAAWLIPGLVAAVATAALLFFSLNFNGKVI